jgi:2-polyprenyl-3-methyl-5-hydroxy-6-metoxy-1,4-benzoquinol methylase
VTEEHLRLTDGGPLGPSHAARLSAGETIRVASVRANAAPVDEGDVLDVVPLSRPARGDIVVCRVGRTLELRRLLRRTETGWLARAEPAGGRIVAPASSLVGLVAAVEQGDLRIDLRRPRWRACARLLATLPPAATGLGRGLARLERLRRPLYPPIRMGSAVALTAGVRRAYDHEASLLDAGDDLTDTERLLLARWLRPGMRILDAGAGAGREAIALARAGLDVLAIDVAPAMVDRARDRASAAGVRVTFDVGDVATYKPDRRLDVVYLATGVYNHIPTAARRVATLRHVARLLEPDGFVILAPVIFPAAPRLSRARVVDGLRRALRAIGLPGIAEPGDGYHRGLALARVPHAFRYVHRFTARGDVEAEIAAADLVVLDCLEDAAIWRLRRAL